MTANNVAEETLNNNTEGPSGAFTWGNRYDGIVYPFFFPEEPSKHLESIQHMDCHASDSFVCSYPKSGTHWILEIVSMLKRGSASHSENYNFLDVVPRGCLSRVSEPRIFASHLRYDRLPEQAKSKRCKIFYCLRNPKDLAVSLFNFSTRNKSVTYTGTWEEFLDDFFNGNVLYSSWFDHVRSWEQVKCNDNSRPVLFVFYEDLKENVHKEIQRIAEFLEVSADDKMIDEIAKNTTLSHMREQKFTYFPHPAESLDPDHMEMLFRKGEVGDWQEWFSTEQDRRMDELLSKKMKDSQLKFKFRLEDKNEIRV